MTNKELEEFMFRVMSSLRLMDVQTRHTYGKPSSIRGLEKLYEEYQDKFQKLEQRKRASEQQTKGKQG